MTAKRLLTLLFLVGLLTTSFLASANRIYWRKLQLHWEDDDGFQRSLNLILSVSEVDVDAGVSFLFSLLETGGGPLDEETESLLTQLQFPVTFFSHTVQFEGLHGVSINVFGTGYFHTFNLASLLMDFASTGQGQNGLNSQSMLLPDIPPALFSNMQLVHQPVSGMPEAATLSTATSTFAFQGGPAFVIKTMSANGEVSTVSVRGSYNGQVTFSLGPAFNIPDCSPSPGSSGHNSVEHNSPSTNSPTTSSSPALSETNLNEDSHPPFNNGACCFDDLSLSLEEINICGEGGGAGLVMRRSFSLPACLRLIFEPLRPLQQKDSDHCSQQEDSDIELNTDDESGSASDPDKDSEHDPSPL